MRLNRTPNAEGRRGRNPALFLFAAAAANASCFFYAAKRSLYLLSIGSGSFRYMSAFDWLR